MTTDTPARMLGEMAREDHPLEMWVVYNRPRDYPDRIVVRRWVVGPGMMAPTPDVTLYDSVEAARAAMPPDRVRLSRFFEDDPRIAEVWL